MPTPKEDLEWLIAKLRLVTVEPILFLFMFAAFLTAPTVQALVYRKVCLQHFNISICDNLKNPEHEDAEDTVQALASHWYMAENLCYEIPSILTSLVYGNVSDHISRRLAIMLPLIGQMLSSLNYIANSAIMNLPVGCILIGPLVSG
jgi:PCFT/HCP family folate transporter-like MFS transporter 1/3